MYHSVVWCCVATFAVNTVGDKGVFKQVSTHLAVVFSASGKPCRLPWISPISLLNTISCFHTPVQSALPLTEKIHFSYHFLIKFTVGRYLQNFLVNSHWTVITDFVESNSSKQWFFKLSHHFMPVLQSRGKRWNYFTNFELLFTILFLLLSYQHIYINADTICNHSVHLKIKCEALMFLFIQYRLWFSLLYKISKKAVTVNHCV